MWRTHRGASVPRVHTERSERAPVTLILCVMRRYNLGEEELTSTVVATFGIMVHRGRGIFPFFGDFGGKKYTRGTYHDLLIDHLQINRSRCIDRSYLLLVNRLDPPTTCRHVSCLYVRCCAGFVCWSTDSSNPRQHPL